MLGSAVVTANSAFSRATIVNDAFHHRPAEGRELARQRQSQVVVILQDVLDGGLGMAAVEAVGASGHGQARLVEHDIDLSGALGSLARCTAPCAPTRASRGRAAGARKSSISAYPPPSMATSPKCDGPLGLFADFVRDSTCEKAARACLSSLSIGDHSGRCAPVQTKHDVAAPSAILPPARFAPPRWRVRNSSVWSR